MTRRTVIRCLAATLAHGSSTVAALRARALLWPWMTTSARMVAELLAYNAFVLLIIEPLLRRWFPPLKPWEHVTGLFGGGRATYHDIAPAVATTLWILGNAMLVVTMNRRMQSSRAGSAPGDTTAAIEPKEPPVSPHAIVLRAGGGHPSVESSDAASAGTPVATGR